MKKALFKIIIPVCVLVLWMITCYPVCNKADWFDYFLYWILVGCPYGTRKMCMFLVPKNFGIGQKLDFHRACKTVENADKVRHKTV